MSEDVLKGKDWALTLFVDGEEVFCISGEGFGVLDRPGAFKQALLAVTMALAALAQEKKEMGE